MKYWSNFPNNCRFFRLCLKVDLMGDDQVLSIFSEVEKDYLISSFVGRGGGGGVLLLHVQAFYVSVTQSYHLQTDSKPTFHGRMLYNSMYGLLSDWFWSRMNDRGLWKENRKTIYQVCTLCSGSLLKMFQVHMNL